MGTIIGYFIIGLLGGAIAKAILPGSQGNGIVQTSLVGIVGALLGGFLGGLLFDVSYDKIFSFSGLLTSVVGALIVLVAWGWFQKRRGASTTA